jgi:hypothetical protein
MQVLEISSKTGQGMEDVVEVIETHLSRCAA